MVHLEKHTIQIKLFEQKMNKKKIMFQLTESIRNYYLCVPEKNDSSMYFGPQKKHPSSLT
jgi:hypothetical protein